MFKNISLCSHIFNCLNCLFGDTYCSHSPFKMIWRCKALYKTVIWTSPQDKFLQVGCLGQRMRTSWRLPKRVCQWSFCQRLFHQQVRCSSPTHSPTLRGRTHVNFPLCGSQQHSRWFHKDLTPINLIKESDPSTKSRLPSAVLAYNYKMIAVYSFSKTPELSKKQFVFLSNAPRTLKSKWPFLCVPTRGPGNSCSKGLTSCPLLPLPTSSSEVYAFIIPCLDDSGNFQPTSWSLVIWGGMSLPAPQL